MMFKVNDIVVLIKSGVCSYTRTNGLSNGDICKLTDSSGSTVRVIEGNGTHYWMREDAFRIATSEEREAYSKDIRNVEAISYTLIGRYLKALEDGAYGTTMKKGDYVCIKRENATDVWEDSNDWYFKRNELAHCKVELMPIGFVPPIKNADSPWFIKADSFITEEVFNKIISDLKSKGYKEDIHCGWVITYSSFISHGYLRSTCRGDNYPSDINQSMFCIDNNTQYISKERDISLFVSKTPKAKPDLNPFKKGDKVMVDLSKFESSFYSSVKTYSRYLEADREYVVRYSNNESGYLSVEGDTYDHPWDIFYTIPPKPATPVIDYIMDTIRSKYPVGTTIIMLEGNGSDRGCAKEYTIKSGDYDKFKSYSGYPDKVSYVTMPGYLYYKGEWAAIVPENKTVSYLPSKWCVKAKNSTDAKLLADYVNSLNASSNDSDRANWSSSDAQTYYLSMEGNRYVGGYRSIDSAFKEITFQQFKEWVLDKHSYKAVIIDVAKQSNVKPSDDLEFQEPILVKRVKSKSKLVIIN